ncbi:MAG: amidase domain-containing protein [Candidatus Nealsonbacteria bacterium]
MAIMPAALAVTYYDRQTAVNYARDYCYNRNPAFRDFGPDDCTNFISQCLLTGGWTEIGKYQDQNLFAWYYDLGYKPFYSNTWAVANDLGQFIINSGRGYKYSLYQGNIDGYVENDQLQIGDVVQIDFNKDGRNDHSTIVTSVNKATGSVGLTYHFEYTGKDNIEIRDLMQQYPNANFYGYHLYT